MIFDSQEDVRFTVAFHSVVSFQGLGVVLRVSVYAG